MAAIAPIRVLVVDDQESFRRALAAVVDVTDGFVMAGSTGSGRQAPAEVIRTSPDLVLVDVRMPDADGAALALQLRRDHPRLTVVLISAYARGDVPIDVLDAGVGFLAKEDVGPETLITLWSSARPA